MRLTCFVALVALALGGCATITSSEYQPISVSTYDKDGARVDKAECVLSNDKGSWEMRTPGFAQVHRSSQDLLVQCRKEGQPEGTARAISRVGAGMFGNIVFGGGVGAIIDHTKGTAYNYPDAVNVRMGSMAIFDRQDDSTSTSATAMAPVAQPVALAAPGTTKTATAVDPSLPSSLPRPGDRWKYQYVDGFNGMAKEVFVHEVVAAKPGEIDEKMYLDGGKAVGDERAFTANEALTLAERPLRKVERAEFGPYLQAFQTKMPLGRFGPINYASPNGPPWQFTGRVLGNELVSVPAGTFDAMKIELNGTRGAGGGPPRAAPVQARYVIWYAPKAKRYVKDQVELWNQYFQPLSKDRFELVEFKLH